MDYYFKANTAQALINALSPPDPAPRFRFQATFRAVLTPQQGRVDVGDPNKWYCCIRSEEQIVAPEGVETCSPEEAIPVIGVWM